MSASPQPPGPGRTPNGGPAIIRRSKTSDPLVRKKNPRNQRRQLPVNPKVTSSQDNSGGATLSTSNAKSASSQSASAGRDGLVGTQESDSKSDTRPKDPRGFSTAVEDCRYFDLVTTKQEILEGLRYHVARFASKKSIDPRDEEEFTRPVRLHRRDPRAPPAGAGGRNGQEDSPDGDSKDNIPDDRERERQEIIREEKEAKRKADLAQIAPTAHSGNNQRRQNAFKKKTQQVFRTNETPEQRAQSKLRYEEAIPWHLEDFDNKNTWVGNYESALSGTYCMLEVSEQKFRMVPMEKWYRFTPKNQFKTLTTEEAEAILGKKVSQPRWIMDSLRKGEGQRMSTADRQAGSNLYIGQFGNKALGRKTGVATKSEAVDADDLDFDEDRFADDEENPVMDGDVEETKDTEERIKRDQLQANIFDLKDEKEIDKEAEEEKRANELKKKEGKGTKKALMAREKNYIYDSSDSDENPYESKTESDNSEDDDEKGDGNKKDEEKKAEKGKGKDPDRISSGASSKGTNTPSGRVKHSDPMKRTASENKRPGSPNLSDASGTDTMRKKQKKKHGSSSQPTARSTPAPGSRQLSPAPSSSAPDNTRPGMPPRQSSIIKLSVESNKLSEISSAAPRPDPKRSRMAAGSGSEGEATGADMSDGNRKKKIKRNAASPPSHSPSGSRAGSPQPNRDGHGSSRAGSPNAQSSKRGPPVTQQEIIDAVPSEGIKTAVLLKKFEARAMDRKVFVETCKTYFLMREGMLVPKSASRD